MNLKVFRILLLAGAGTRQKSKILTQLCWRTSLQKRSWQLKGKSMPRQVEIFPWNDNFATGIEVIDGQHRRLSRWIPEES